MIRPNNDITLWFTWNIYHFKKYGIKRKKWRGLLADLNMKRRKPFDTDSFIKTWEFLERDGLV